MGFSVVVVISNGDWDFFWVVTVVQQFFFFLVLD